jgi:hypothetical protein
LIIPTKEHSLISWRQDLAIKIKLDGKDHTFDTSRWFDGQIERKKLSLEFNPLVQCSVKVSDHFMKLTVSCWWSVLICHCGY